MELFQPLLFDEASLIGTGKGGRGKRSISFHLEAWEYFGSCYKPRHITVLYFSVAKCSSLIRLWCDDALWCLPNMRAKRKVGGCLGTKEENRPREGRRKAASFHPCMYVSAKSGKETERISR